ncbi:right-handed parallel beta-helix repeat-containing protein [Roseimarinus sediminis]|uniref:right-handed parallel beta-helix repeat-containing protein n=1 Tax=Roseimarinus sediminis TaxID=1610899 RepID=UPI003D19A898
MKKLSINSMLGLMLVAITFIGCEPQANTSTGPEKDKALYGPQSKNYSLPEVAGTIYYVAPNGDPASSGTDLNQPATIKTAVSKAQSGDAIVLRGGEYRTGNLTFNQGIVFQAYQNEQPVLKGTLVAENWEVTSDGLWKIKWDHLFPAGPESWWRREREEKYTPLHRFNNDGVFIDGQFLESAGSMAEVKTGTHFVDYEKGEIYIADDPAGKLVEITAFRKAIVRTTAEIHGRQADNKGPVFRGLTITQYPDTMVHIDGYYPQGISAETEHGKDVVGTVFEDCTFSKSFRIAVFALGDSMVMRHCKIEDSNTEGLYLVASSDVLLEWNIFANNNIERWTGFFPAAVKIFNQTHRVVCRNNLIIDHPNSNGLWYDVGNVDGVFVNNWVENIGNVDKFGQGEHIWSNYSGFFYEISTQAICAGNVFLNCDQGAFILNSSKVDVYNNTFVNSTASFGRNSRGDDADHFGWHIRTGPAVDARDQHTFKNNLFYIEEKIDRQALTAWQPADMCERLNKPQFAELNNNLYLRQQANSDKALIHWSPANNENCSEQLSDPAALQTLYPGFEGESKYYPASNMAVFTDFDQNDFSLNADTLLTPAILPEKVQKALGLATAQPAFTGAWPGK